METSNKSRVYAFDDDMWNGDGWLRVREVFPDQTEEEISPQSAARELIKRYDFYCLGSVRGDVTGWTIIPGRSFRDKVKSSGVNLNLRRDPIIGEQISFGMETPEGYYSQLVEKLESLCGQPNLTIITS